MSHYASSSPRPFAKVSPTLEEHEPIDPGAVMLGDVTIVHNKDQHIGELEAGLET